MSSAAERGPASQAPPIPRSTLARMTLAPSSFGANVTTLADSALSPSSFHHSGLATPAHCSDRSMSKATAVTSAAALRAHRVALLGLEVPLRGLHAVPRTRKRVAEVEVRPRLVGPQGDGLAVGPGCSAQVLIRLVPDALSQ